MAAGSSVEKTKPPEEVSAHPGGNIGGKAGEHGDQQGKPVHSLPAFAVPVQYRAAQRLL